MRIFLVLLFIFGLENLAIAQQRLTGVKRNLGVLVDALQSEGDTENILTLTGQVQIIFKDQHLRSDRAKVNFRAKTIEAEGNVILTSPQATVGGSRVLLDFEANTGVIYEGYIKSGPIFFEGNLISKLSADEYLVEEASFTSCANCPETWLFSGSKIRAQLGGYAFIKNSWLKVGGFKVFWLPYLIVPLKSDRQTGILTPELEKSDSGGLTVGESFFWAIDRSQDATITLKSYEKRGPKSIFNYRYKLSEISEGEFSGATLRDRAFGNDNRLKGFRKLEEAGQPINRWFTKYEHYIDLPEGFVHRLQVNNASDLQYPKDFSLETRNNGDSAMENRMSLTKNTLNSHFSVDTSYYVNLLQSNPLASNNDAVHRAPEVRYSKALSNIGDSTFLYSFDVNSTHFYRADFGYDDLNAGYNPAGGNNRHVNAEGKGDDGLSLADCATDRWYYDPRCSRFRDGEFDPNTDLIRTGHRLDVKGSISRPMKLTSFIDVIPKLSYRETDYQFNIPNDSTNQRRLIRGELTSRSLFSRVYGDTANYRGDRIKHEIQPELTYTFIPWISHPSHPFFGNQRDAQDAPFFSQDSLSDADLNGPYGIQFDYNDRIFERRLVTFAFLNKLIRKRWSGDRADYGQFLFWRVAQSYDFHQAELDTSRKQALSDLSSDFRLNLDQLTIFQKANYYPYQQVTKLSSRVRWSFLSGDFFELGHTLDYTITPGQEVVTDARTEEYTLTLRKVFAGGQILGKMAYDSSPSKVRSDQRLKSYGFVARLKLPGDCWYFNLSQYRTAGGDNNSSATFDFSWDGTAKPNLPEDLINSLYL